MERKLNAEYLNKRNSQKVNKVLFSSDFIQMLKNGEKDKAIQLYKEQRNISLEEAEKYIADLEKSMRCIRKSKIDTLNISNIILFIFIAVIIINAIYLTIHSNISFLVIILGIGAIASLLGSLTK